MKLASWNINSLNVRLPRLLDWLSANAPDVICLQETKLEDAKFPVGPLEAAEQLEQLRALENGIEIAVVKVLHDSVGVDVPGDAERVAKLLNR